ncbi:MAG: 16S rRNA (guanine(966)-N(2))-methyltransferase RsmD [Bacteroidetes bacterium]|nr:16S rRNA (guanine(966)-N(2))-methyltransferase RsmD [Bacteroidota bacterium]
MRIIAGDMKGRLLHMPRRASFRPTTDRVKEAMFNILSGLVHWEQCRVCDLFAGSGNLGLEALSRGAPSVLFVENDGASRDVLERNISALRVQSRTRVLPFTVERFCRHEHDTCELLFADPPYAYETYDTLLSCCSAILVPDGIAVIEHTVRKRLESQASLTVIDHREYGTTAITIVRSPSGEPS